MKRESITALHWYFLNCSVTQFYWVQVFSSPKYIHVSEESSTNLLLINKLLLTKDEEPNSHKQYLRGCRMILSQIFSFLPYPPFPPHLLLFLSIQLWGRGVPIPLGTSTHSGGEVTQPHPEPAKLRDDLSQGTWLRGSHLPIRRKALSHACKWNFLRSLFNHEAKAIFWHCACSGNTAEATGSGTKPPILRPSSPAVFGLPDRMGEIATLPSALPVISHLFNPTFLPRSLGRGQTC